jgi:hypothetical protein
MTLLEQINSNPSQAMDALNHVYRGKVYVVGTEYGTIHDMFKTRRGAEGYIKRESRFSWYDEMTQSMVNAGSGLIIEEIHAEDIEDPRTSIRIWYVWLKEVLGREYMYDSVLHTARHIGVSDEVMAYVTDAIEQMKRGEGLRVLDETNTVQTTETTDAKEQTAEDEAQQEEECTEHVSATVRINEKLNGIEIVFDDKPSEEIRAQLKAYGFRWSKRGFWYAKRSPERITFAESLTQSHAETVDTTPTYPDIDIDDIDTYTVDEQLQRAEHDANWVFRRNEIDRTAEIRTHFQHWTDEVKSVLATTDNPRITYELKSALQRYKRKYFENYLAQLRHRANNPSWVVTGRSGLNMSRYNKALDRYDRLIAEGIELTERLKRTIEKAKTEIRRDKEQRTRKQAAQMDVDTVEWKTETREIEMYGISERCRVHITGPYMIAKTWGCWRIFQNGKQIHSMKSTDRLEDAKKYVVLLIQNEQKAS